MYKERRIVSLKKKKEQTHIHLDEICYHRKIPSSKQSKFHLTHISE